MKPFTSEQLSNMSLSELVSAYNKVALELKAPYVNKFSSKANGQSRIAKLQKELPAVAAKPKAKPKAEPTVATKPKAEPKAEPTVATKPKAKPKAEPTTPGESFGMNIDGERVVFVISECKVSIEKISDKCDSIRSTFEQAISDTSGSLDKVIEAFIVLMPEAPKSGEKVNQAFVIRRLKRLVRKGYFKMTKV